MNYTVYISNIQNGGIISLTRHLFFQTEYQLKKDIEKNLVNDSNVKDLPDGKYQAVVCDDNKMSPLTVSTTNNLANAEGYIITKDLTNISHTVTIQ